MFSLGKSEEGRGKEVDMETVDIFKTATMQETYFWWLVGRTRVYG